MNIKFLDHLVLTVKDVHRTCNFYGDLLGLEIATSDHGRKYIRLGDQHISLHPHGREFEPHAQRPAPGSVELCFVTEMPVGELADHLEGQGVELLLPPHPRTGARGAIESLFLYDPDGNLVEISNYVDDSPDGAQESAEIRGGQGPGAAPGAPRGRRH